MSPPRICTVKVCLCARVQEISIVLVPRWISSKSSSCQGARFFLPGCQVLPTRVPGTFTLVLRRATIVAHAKEGRIHSPAGHRMSERTKRRASCCGKKGNFVHSFCDGWRIWESWKLNWNCLYLNLLISAWRICSSCNPSLAEKLPYLSVPCNVYRGYVESERWWGMAVGDIRRVD